MHYKNAWYKPVLTSLRKQIPPWLIEWYSMLIVYKNQVNTVNGCHAPIHTVVLNHGMKKMNVIK